MLCPDVGKILDNQGDCDFVLTSNIFHDCWLEIKGS